MFSVALILIMLVLVIKSPGAKASSCPICPICNGTTELDCTECNGTGCDNCASGKVICNTCQGTGYVASSGASHDLIPATSTSPAVCKKCGAYQGNILITDDMLTTDVYVPFQGSLHKNELSVIGSNFYVNCFVVNDLPVEGFDFELSVSTNQWVIESSDVIYNLYYLTSNKTVYYFQSGSWEEMVRVEEHIFAFGGIISSVDEIIIPDEDNIPISFYVLEPKIEREYYLNLMYQVDDEDIVTDIWYYNNSFLSIGEMLVDYTSELFLQNLRDEYKEKYFISKIEFCPAGKSPAVSLQIIPNGDKVNLVYTDEYEYNTFVITLSYKFQGIKYYFENNLVYTDTRTTWDNATLWNASTIDKTTWCSFEKLVYQERSKQKAITSADELKEFAKEYTLNNGYIEVDLLKVHDNYYYGSSIIYKKNTAFLTADTINQILSENILSCEHTLTYVFEDVNYVGNGTKLGTYSYKIKFDDKEVIIKIVVTDKINSDYIYGNHLYYPINNKLSTGQIVDDMKKTGLIVNTNLSTQFTGRNESSSNFLSGKNNQVGTYSYVVDYESATGESGTTQVFLDILEAKVFTTDDPVPEEKDYKEIVENVIAIAIMVIIVFIICWLLFGRKKRRR